MTSKKTDEKINYFQTATSWADDYYTMAIASRNRWKAGVLYVALPITCLSLLCVLVLVPAQRIEPMIVHHYEDGHISVDPVSQIEAPTNKAEMESELVRYVISRESYDSTSYDNQYQLVNWLSNNNVAREYMQTQSHTNKFSPINRLSDHGIRTVHIENVVFLDNQKDNDKPNNHQKHHNLAEINFTVTDSEKNGSAKASKPMTALISWDYRGTPNDPDQKWRNWDGFTVTSYQLQQRSVS